MADRSFDVGVGEVVIHVEGFGRTGGDPVFVLHGFTGNIESMRPAIDPLAEHFEVFAIDLIGHGRSSAPADLEPYRMASCVEQLVAVMGALDRGAAHFLGYSMGGRVALSLCAAAPGRVLSALLVGASPGLRDAQEAKARRESDEVLARRIEEEGLAAFVDHWMSIPLFASQQRLGEAALARARAERLRCDPQGLAMSLRGMGTGSMPPLHGALGDMRMPIGLVAGELDAKFRALATRMSEALPRGECLVIEDAGHAAHIERPGAFARAALRFFGVAAEEGGAGC